MKLCAAQIKPIKGDIEANIEKHKRLIDLAIANGADTIIFPELSITGYEPALAKELATTADDDRFNIFQTISDTKNITIGIGMPTQSASGICITMILFRPHKKRETYSKKYLHADEELFFVSGQGSISSINDKIALAICYEISVPEHSATAARNGAEIYVASVAKSESGVEKAVETLSAIARKYSMKVVMSNAIGYCDNFIAVGRSSAWNKNGELVAQLDGNNEGILIYDTSTTKIIKQYLSIAEDVTAY